MHGVAYDAVNDEIIVPVALSGAVLVFAGGAQGDEPPKRVIQGQQTELIRPQTIEVDPVSGEIIAGDPSAQAVIIFDRLANGDAKPKRIIRGPKTQFREIIGVASDARHDAILVASRGPDALSGIFIFSLKDEGNVAPRRMIAGPLTGALGRFRQLAVDPERGKIYLAVQSAFQAQMQTPQKAANLYTNEEELRKLREWEASRQRAGRSGGGGAGEEDDDDPSGGLGFIGVWNIDDSGNVPPRMLIRGRATKARGFAGVAFDPVHGEVFGIHSNAVYTFLVPEFFQKPGARQTAH